MSQHKNKFAKIIDMIFESHDFEDGRLVCKDEGKHQAVKNDFSDAVNLIVKEHWDRMESDTVLNEKFEDIESKLEKTASDIDRGSMSKFSGAPDPESDKSPLQKDQDEDTPDEDDDLKPDAPMGSELTDDEKDEMISKEIDSVLVATAKNHPYSKNYQHDENSKIHPFQLLGKSLDELYELRTMVINKERMEKFNTEFGSYESPNVQFYNDLISFIEKIILSTKTSSKEYLDKKEGKTAKVEKRPESKTKPGNVKKPKGKSNDK